jgi:predicted TIM-barrel fold metal-dependent hydrolase
VLLGHKEISDMIAALICQGTLSRFPKLRIASIESGASWIRGLIEDLELAYRQMPQQFDEDPVRVFRRNCWVSPFWEGSVAQVVDWLGWDKVMFGIGLPAPGRYDRTQGVLQVRRGHGREASTRLHGRQRPPPARHPRP